MTRTMPRAVAAGPVRSCVLPALSALLLGGCESAAVETTTRQMDSASDVALLCAEETRDADGNATWAGTTMDRCNDDDAGQHVCDTCALFAFVVQRERGELAAVNLRDRRLLDLDIRQPLSSPAVVGLLPNAIAAAPDGSSLAVANLGDPRPGEDPANPDGVPYLSVVAPSNLLPGISPDADRPFVSRIALPEPASNVAYLDPTHVVVTLPKHRGDPPQVVVVTLGETPVVGPPTVLEPFPLLDAEGQPLPGLSVPWSLLVDEGRRRIIVGDREASRLAILTWDDAYVLTVTGLAGHPDALPGPATALAIEPAGWDSEGVEAGRWIYAVDGRSGGVMVLDAVQMALDPSDPRVVINISEHDPMDWRWEIDIPGLAQDVLIGRVFQADAPAAPEPEALHGTFGFIVSSVGEVYVVDLQDHASADCWVDGTIGERYLSDEAPGSGCPRHVLRNRSADNPGPELADAPVLKSGLGVNLAYAGAPDASYPRFHDFGGATPDGDPSYGVTFDDDVRRAVSQKWIVEYEAIIPWTDGVGGQVGEAGWFTDRAMPFCARGVLAGDILIIKNGPPDDEDNPTRPLPDCRPWRDAVRLEYRIGDALGHGLQLAEVPNDATPDVGDDVLATLPDPGCFPYAVEYEIRVGRQWLVRGEATGFQHHVTSVDGVCSEGPGETICTPYENCTTEPVDFRCLHSGRATEGLVHKNPFLCFTMDPGSGGAGSTVRGTTWELDAVGGFAPLVVETGYLPVAGALDLTNRTGPALLVVDSSSDGLIRVDLEAFDVSDNWP